MTTSESVDPNERVEVSVVLRPRATPEPPEQQAARHAQPMTREAYAASFGADPSDLERVAAFARTRGLDVVESSQARRTVRLAGRAEDVASAFGVTFECERQPDGTLCRVASGPAQLPADLRDTVQGVFGLDTRPIARRL
jgi:kumamolisin